MENLLATQEVSKRYGKHLALNNVSLQIPKGSIFGLLGPNGAGKTTLIRIINRITMPDAGTVFFDNHRLRPEDVQQIGYLPEERGLYKSMKVGEQALYLAQLKGLGKSEAKQRLQHWFERLEIDGWWNKKIEELSKGMAQKIQFVVTVLHRPKLLIFDEPFSGFDPVNANLIKNEILELQRQGATVIFSTHRMESVEEVCSHIALINRSEKVLDGKLSEIKKSYKSNTFEVGLSTPDPEGLQQKLGEKFTLSPATFNSLGDELKLRIQIPNGSTPNDLLGYLVQQAQVNHFVEVIPGVNEIFIQTVSNGK